MLSRWIRFACFLFVIVDWYTRNSTVVEISHETPRLACFAYPHKCKKASFSCTAAHIFVSPENAPVIITQYVAWMEKQFNACQTPRSIYPPSFNSFPVIRTESAKNRRYHVPRSKNRSCYRTTRLLCVLHHVLNWKVFYVDICSFITILYGNKTANINIKNFPV